MDRVALHGIDVFAHHGVHPAERELGQRFVVDVELALDLEAALADDDLARTVDYGAVHDRVVAVVGGSRCRLLETVAAQLCRALLDDFAPAAVTVTVRKPHPPIPGFRGSAEVTLVRDRGWTLRPGSGS